MQHLAQAQGARLTKAQLAQRLGCHRNTLRARVAAKGFPTPCSDGKWMLSEIIEWEQGNARHNAELCGGTSATNAVLNGET